MVSNFKYFESQEPHEDIIQIVRRHWVSLYAPLVLGTILVLFGTFLFLLIRYNHFFVLSSFWKEIQNVVWGILFIFLSAFIFTSWMLNYLDILIITSKRIVIVEQNTLFSRKVSVLDLEAIQDVSITAKGFFQTVMGMGEIFIQTAGEMPNFQYKHIGNPEDVQMNILKAKEAHALKTGVSNPV